MRVRIYWSAVSMLAFLTVAGLFFAFWSYVLGGFAV